MHPPIQRQTVAAADPSIGGPDGAGSLAESYAQVRQYTLDICAPLCVDDYGVQPTDDVSPPKWHLAHTTWFFETFLLKSEVQGYSVFDPAFEFLFNSYYNGIGAQHPRTQRGDLSRPTLEDVLGYRHHVDEAMHKLLGSQLTPEVQQSVVMGLHHEQQHQELLTTDIKYILGTNPTHPAYVAPLLQPSAESAAPSAMKYVEFAGGLREVGCVPTDPAEAKQLNERPFHFDNETPRHKTYLHPFRFAERLVTNAEFLAFIEDGGYGRSDLWLSEGWTALNTGVFGPQGAPLYWRQQSGRWLEYHLVGLQPLQLHVPVCHISFFEADAYARWAGKRLPTEFEWEVAATSTPSPQVGDPTIQQLSDCLWQWTRSAYLPYPGYQPLPGTLGEYNGKFMSSQMVLRGGSAATPPGHNRVTYRNFFYPPDRWQFTGIRLAADVPE